MKTSNAPETKNLCLDTYRNNSQLFKNSVSLNKKQLKKHSEKERIANLFFIISKQLNLSYLDSKKYLNKSNKLKECNSTLFKYINLKTNEENLISFFCKDRFCPTCQYNDELKHFKIFSEIVNDEQVKNKKWLFITLTIKNSFYDENDLQKSIDNLKEACRKILDGFNAINKSKKSFLRNHSLGMFRSLEVTRNKNDGSFHPHLHILSCVDDDYSKNSDTWIFKEKLQKVWQKALKVDYLPIVDIELIYNDKGHAIAEVSKYQTKSKDVSNAETLYILENALSHTQMRGYTGIVKELKKKIDERYEKSEKIDIHSIMMNSDFVKCFFKFDSFKQCFRYDHIGTQKLNDKIKNEIERKELIAEALSLCVKK